MKAAEPPIIGKNMQKIRKQQKLTLDVLSEKSGVSKAMLSQIESKKVNPTVATVWKISQGLQVDINKLLEGGGDSKRKFSVVRNSDITNLETDEDGLHMKVLSPVSMVEDLEMYLLTFEPGGSLNSRPHFPRTEEFLTLISGKLHVKAGDNNTDLSSGDFISYHCDIEHTITNTSDSVSLAHLVVRFNKQTRD